MAIIEVAVVPVGTDDPSFSSFVAKAREAVQARGIKHQVTPMSTILEGTLDDVLDCAREMHEAALRAGASRVVTNISIDQRTDRPDSMAGRVAAVTDQTLADSQRLL